MIDTSIVEAHTRFLEKVAGKVQPGKKYTVTAKVTLPNRGSWRQDGAIVNFLIKSGDQVITYSKSGGGYDHDEKHNLEQDAIDHATYLAKEIGMMVASMKNVEVKRDGLSFTAVRIPEKKMPLEERLRQFPVGGATTNELTAQAVRAFPQYEDEREALAVYMGEPA